MNRLAETLGAKYTRYVDDLLFSGPSDLAVGALPAAAWTISSDEGFRLAERKTAVLRASRQQRVLGVVLNSRPSVSRAERDRLRAILHNCRVHGVRSQCRADVRNNYGRSWPGGSPGWPVSTRRPAPDCRLTSIASTGGREPATDHGGQSSPDSLASRF
jgi:RNA-directed DNA polymerase